MFDLIKILARLAAGGGQVGILPKPVDYEHPLVFGDPIDACCEKMASVAVIRHDCDCPGQPHNGAIVHSKNCQCPDRFIPMTDEQMLQPPPIAFTDGKERDTKIASIQLEQIVTIEIQQTQKGGHVNRLDSMN